MNTVCERAPAEQQSVPSPPTDEDDSSQGPTSRLPTATESQNAPPSSEETKGKNIRSGTVVRSVAN